MQHGDEGWAVLTGYNDESYDSQGSLVGVYATEEKAQAGAFRALPYPTYIQYVQVNRDLNGE